MVRFIQYRDTVPNSTIPYLLVLFGEYQFTKDLNRTFQNLSVTRKPSNIHILSNSFTVSSSLIPSRPYPSSSKSSPVSPTLSPSSSTRAQTMVAPASAGPYGSSGSSGSYGLGTAAAGSYGTAGSYAVAPRPIALPQPTSPYVR